MQYSTAALEEMSHSFAPSAILLSGTARRAAAALVLVLAVGRCSQVRDMLSAAVSATACVLP